MDKTPLELAEAYANGDKVAQQAWEDGFVAGIMYQTEKEAQRLVRGEQLTRAYSRIANEVWQRATGQTKGKE